MFTFTFSISIINYTAAIWGHRKYSSTKQIQNQAMRAFLGVVGVTPICPLQDDLGWAGGCLRLFTQNVKWLNCSIDSAPYPVHG